jgi:shikimate dehydrogenase
MEYAFMTTMRVGVIGDPVAHSLSPVFQQPAFDALGIAASYERWHTTLEQLPDRIASLRKPDALGANVTVPHKSAVLELVDEPSDLGARIGAINTIINRGGQLLGDNTDVYGFQRSLVERRPTVERDRVLVIGAGGAARAIVAALADLGVAGLTVANRSTQRAEEMVRDLKAEGTSIIPLSDWDLTNVIRDHSVIVNATSIGWNDDQRVLDPALVAEIDPDGLVVDLTYRDTTLLMDAISAGIGTLDGLPMLVYQGARSFELWTGQEPPVNLMMAAAERARHPDGM